MDYTQVKKVGIIGAGVAGLAAAKALLARGLDCTVFDRDAQLGGVWNKGYYKFGVQVQKELYEFPDFPLPDDAPNFTPGPVFQAYMQDYAERYGVASHIRFQTRIQAIARHDGGWRLTILEDGAEKTEDFDLVVVATGLYSDKPNIPEIPGRSDYQGEVLHAYDIQDTKPLEGQRVAVVGYGKSATDAVLTAREVGKEAHLIFRTAHWPVPRNLAGLLPFKWGMLNRMTAALIPPYIRPSPLVGLIHGVGKPLVWTYWRLVEVLLATQFGLGMKIAKGENLKPTKPVEYDCFGESTMVPRPPLFKAIKAGEITAHRTSIAKFTPDGVVLGDGDELQVDRVVFATGWHHDFDFLGAENLAAIGQEDDGFYLYRQMLHPGAPGLVFIGYASTFLSVATYSLQAHWLAQLIAGKVQLPSDQAQLEEIESLKSWRRAWMPYSTARGTRVLLHQLYYHDELLKDFGENPLRKRGPFAPLLELFAPYQPSDFKDIVATPVKSPAE